MGMSERQVICSVCGGIAAIDTQNAATSWACPVCNSVNAGGIGPVDPSSASPIAPPRRRGRLRLGIPVVVALLVLLGGSTWLVARSSSNESRGAPNSERDSGDSALTSAEINYCTGIDDALAVAERLREGTDLPQDALDSLRPIQLQLEQAESVLLGSASRPAPDGRRVGSSYVAEARRYLVGDYPTFGDLGRPPPGAMGAVALESLERLRGTLTFC